MIVSGDQNENFQSGLSESWPFKFSEEKNFLISLLNK
jgi:hypothetical protein